MSTSIEKCSSIKNCIATWISTSTSLFPTTTSWASRARMWSWWRGIIGKWLRSAKKWGLELVIWRAETEKWNKIFRLCWRNWRKREWMRMSSTRLWKKLSKSQGSTRWKTPVTSTSQEGTMATTTPSRNNNTSTPSSHRSSLRPKSMGHSSSNWPIPKIKNSLLFTRLPTKIPELASFRNWGDSPPSMATWKGQDQMEKVK